LAAFAKGNAAANPEYVGTKVLKILGSMAQAGLMKRDMLLNAFVRYKVADHSRLRLDKVLQLDRALVDLLAKEEPDPEGWMRCHSPPEPAVFATNNSSLPSSLCAVCSEASAGTDADLPAPMGSN